MYLADTLSRHYLETEDGVTAAKVSHIRSKFKQELETDEGLDEINQLVQEAQENKYHVQLTQARHYKLWKSWSRRDGLMKRAASLQRQFHTIIWEMNGWRKMV